MANKQVQNIVLACENEDAQALVNSVNQSLFEKLSSNVETIRKDIGNDLFEGFILENDIYEQLKPEVKEAIDYVVENADESLNNVDECIKVAADKFGISESEVRDYMDGSNWASAHVDSTTETGDGVFPKNGDQMGDEDITKRVRFEATATDVMNAIIENQIVVFEDGNSMKLDESTVKTLESVYKRLNEENQNEMVERLTSDRRSMLSIMAFVQKAKS